MLSDEYAVAIVVDASFGERLNALAERVRVWIVDSPTNEGVALRIRSNALEYDREHQIEILRGLNMKPEKMCAGFLRVLVENHFVSSHDPALSTIEVYGASLSPQLRTAFQAEGFHLFTTTEDGFTARRPENAITPRGVPKPLGLALSGGGFRASAFHLGVLKRLRELEILESVDIVSTVSGGSITGAHWVNWQARRGNTIRDASEWDKFESSLIGYMMYGAREWVVWRAFWLPFLSLLELTLLAAAFSWRLWFTWHWTSQLTVVLAIMGAIGSISYCSWHYRAARLFETSLDRELFNGSTLADLSADRTVEWPQLIVNATGLNSGDHLLGAPVAGYGTPGGKLLRRVLPDTSGIPPPRRKRSRIQHRDVAPRVTLALATPLARAVAASCAIPPVFAPLRIPDPMPWWEQPTWWPGRFLAVDGGVRDNQGTQVLLDGHCRGAIVSDAAAALRTVPSPGTWQLFGPGRGVIFRSQDIIYEQVRDLRYQRLEERYNFSLRLREAGLLDVAEATNTPILDGYSYVELYPSDEFRWGNESRLSDHFTPLVASIRTDLDRFSNLEISALMFHGYTMIDHCIRAYQPQWLPQSPPQLCFSSPVKDVCINWEELSGAEVAHYFSHLAVSNSRMSWYRTIRRPLIQWRLRKQLDRALRNEISNHQSQPE